MTLLSVFNDLLFGLSVALTPSTPMKDERLATAGSSSTACASACWRSAMAAKEIDCGASDTP